MGVDGHEILTKMTNFNIVELKFLFNVMKKLLLELVDKRCQKFKDTPLNLLFMLFSVLKNGFTWHFGAAMLEGRSLHLKRHFRRSKNCVKNSRRVVDGQH